MFYSFEAYPFLLQRLGLILGYPVAPVGRGAAPVKKESQVLSDSRGVYIALPRTLAADASNALLLPVGAQKDPLARELILRFLRYCTMAVGQLRTPERIRTALVREEQFLWDNLVFSLFYACREKYSALALLSAARESSSFRFEGTPKALGIICTKDWGELRKRLTELGATVLMIEGTVDLLGSLRSTKLAHLLSDGIQSYFVVDLAGRALSWISLPDELSASSGPGLGWELVPQEFWHLRRLLVHGNTSLVSTPLQEVYVMDQSHAFKWSTRAWHRVSGEPLSVFLSNYASPEAAKRLVSLAVMMSKQRTGALIVVAKEPGTLLTKSSTPIDEMFGVQPLFPITEVSLNTLVCLASLDGALVVDTKGRLVTAGAILELPRKYTRAGEGARIAAASFSSTAGVSILVSNDGPVSIYRDGELYLRFG